MSPPRFCPLLLQLIRLNESQTRLFSRSGVVTSSRYSRSSSTVTRGVEHRVYLDGQTLYINKEIAEALGWKPQTTQERIHSNSDGIGLSLHGWAPNYFTITPKGSDSCTSAKVIASVYLYLIQLCVSTGRLAKNSVESSQEDNVKRVLAYLKDR